jgi:hypothetical protein
MAVLLVDTLLNRNPNPNRNPLISGCVGLIFGLFLMNTISGRAAYQDYDYDQDYDYELPTSTELPCA